MPRKLLYEITGAKKLRFFLVLLAALALQAFVSPRFCAAKEASVKEQVFATVEPFYSWVLAHRSVSLPSDKERSELAAFLMPDLIQLMKDAEAMEGRCAKAAPEGDKPMMFEGALLVSNYEGATEVAYEELKTDKNVKGVVKLPVILASVDEYHPRASRFRAVAWNEEVELLLKDGKWLISNIKFPYNRNLRSILQDFNDAGRRECVVPGGK
jgi:hypothetical protein